MEEGAQDAERADEEREDAIDRLQSVSQARSTVRSRVHGSEDYKHTSLIRRQHRRNLLAIMRHAMLTSDYVTAAGAIATLLVCMPEAVHLGGFGPNTAELNDSLLEIIWNMLELLRQHNTALEQLKRCLTKVAVLLKNIPLMRQVTQLEVILCHWTKDKVELRRCLDLINDEVGRKHLLALSRTSARNYLYHLSLIEGFIRHSSWMDQLLNVTSTRALSSQFASQFSSQASVISISGSSTTTQAQINQELLGPLQLGPFAPRDDAIDSSTQPSMGFTQPSVGFSQIGLGGTQMSQGFSQPGGGGNDTLEAVKRAFRRALDQLPAALLPALLLCHTLMLTDQQDEAAGVAAAAVNASGRSTEALSLLALVREYAAMQAVDAAYRKQSSASASQGLSQHAAAIRASQAGSSAIAAAADDDDDEMDIDEADAEQSIHSYVDVCAETLQSDPWQQGAVQGLIQMCGHCHHCSAQAIKGLLWHITAAAAASDPVCGSDPSTPLHTLWSVLSVLIMQLAAQVSLDAAAQQKQSARPQQQQQQPAAAAAAGSHQHVSMDTDHPTRPSRRSAAAAARGRSPAAAAAVTPVQQIWEQLQESFRSIHFWWTMAGGVADVSELEVLWPKQPQDQLQQEQPQQQQQRVQGQQMDLQQTQQTVADIGLGQSGVPSQNDAAAALTAAVGGDQQDMDLVLLRGSGSDTDSHDSQQVRDHDTVQDGRTKAAAAGAARATSAAVGNQAGNHTVVMSEWDVEHQMLCCKAMALLFILGLENQYSSQAAEALEAAVAAAAAAKSCNAGDSDIGGSRDDPSGLSLTSARDALEDAFHLAQATTQWLKLRRQQKLQELLNQQQHQVTTRRLLGAPNDLFGGMLDLPESWWRCFPQKRRMQQP